MTEYGLFSDEGCFYGPCYTKADAEAEMAVYAAEEDGRWADLYSVKELCPDHEGQPKDGCEECFAEYDEEED